MSLAVGSILGLASHASPSMRMFQTWIYWRRRLPPCASRGPWVLVGRRFRQSIRSSRRWHLPCPRQLSVTMRSRFPNVHIRLRLPCSILGIVIALPLYVQYQIALVLSVMRLKHAGAPPTLTNLCPTIFSTTYLRNLALHSDPMRCNAPTRLPLPPRHRFLQLLLPLPLLAWSPFLS